MPSSRRRLRPFLIDKLNSGQFKGLRWVDKAQGKFRIPWKHGAKQGWSPEDSHFFKEWARHTGKFVEGVDNPQWSTWKTRIRCAFNKSPDIVEIKAESNTDDRDDPYKVYEFKGPIEEPHVRPDASRHKPGSNTWLCKVCSRGFPDVGKFLQHSHSHVEERNNNTVSESAATSRVAEDMSVDDVKPYVCALCDYCTEREVEYEQHQHSHVMEADTGPEPHTIRPTSAHNAHTDTGPEPHTIRPTSTHNANTDNKRPRIIILPKPSAENTGHSHERTPPIDLLVMSRLSLSNSVDSSGETAALNLSSSANGGHRFKKAPPIHLPVNSKYIFANYGHSQDNTRPINLPVNSRQAAAREEYAHDKTPPINLRLCAQCDYCTLCGDDLERHLQQTHNKTVSPKDKLQIKVKEDGEKDKRPTHHDNQRESKKQKLQDTKEMPTDSHKYVVEINLPATNGGNMNAASDVKKDGNKKLISVLDLVEWSSILEGANSDSKKVLVLQPTIHNPSPANNEPSTSRSHVKPTPPNPKPSTSKANVDLYSTNPKPSTNKVNVEPSPPNPKPATSKGDTNPCPPSIGTGTSPLTACAATVSSPGTREKMGGPLTKLHAGNIYRVTSKQHSDPDTGSVYRVTTKKPVNNRTVDGSPGTSNKSVSRPNGNVNVVSSNKPVNPSTVNVKSVTSKSNSPIVRISPIISDSIKRPSIEHVGTITNRRLNSPPTVKINPPPSDRLINAPPVNVSTVVSRRQSKPSTVNRNPFFSRHQTMFVDKTMANVGNKTMQFTPRGEAKKNFEIEKHDNSKMPVLSRRLNNPVNVSRATRDSSSTRDTHRHCDPPTTDVPLDLSSKSKAAEDHPSESSTQPVISCKIGDLETNDLDSSSSGKIPRKERVRHNPNVNKQLQRLRPWLTDKLNAGNIKGLYWLNKQSSIFRIPWKHGGKHDWSPEHSQIFKEWAKHTGKFREGADEWAKWKTRIRCAFNKSPEIVEVKELANIGAETLDPYKVYLFKDADQDSPLWPCEVCFETFPSVHTRDAHRLSHDDILDIKPYVCPLCEFCSQSQQLFYEHQCTHSIGTVEVLPMVLGSYIDGGAAEETAVVESFLCDLCTYCTENQADYALHHQTHTIGTIETFTIKHEDDEGASEEMTGISSFTCDQCDYCTGSQQEYDQHQEGHRVSTMGTLTVSGDTEFADQHQQVHSVSTMDAFTVKADTEFEECSDEETAVITSYVCDPDDDDMETGDLYHQDQWTLVKENDDTNSPEAEPSANDQGQAVEETSDIKSFICDKCGTCMDSQELLELHQQSHDISTVETLTISQEPDDNGYLDMPTDDNAYLDMPNDVKPYACDDCHYCTLNKEDYEHHLQTHQLKPMCVQTVVKEAARTISDNLDTEATDVKPHGCEDCDYCTLNKEDYELHLQSHVVNAPQIVSDEEDTERPDPPACFICEVCGKAYKKRQRLDRHLQMHIAEEAPACTQCGKTFRTMSTLNNHLKLHTTGQDGAPLACVVCAKEQRDAYVLKKHMREHWTKMTHTCTLCKADFPHFTTFKIHVKAQYKGGCGKGFSERSQLEAHTKSCSTGSQTTPHECKYCEKHFKDVDSLYQHSKTHMATPTRPPKPAKNRKSRLTPTNKVTRVQDSGHFVWKTVGSTLAFTKQKEMHIDRRVLVCSDCVLGHSQRSALKTHTLTIRDMMYHVCSECGNRFSQEADHQVHILPYTGTMDHVCSDCGKGFSQESSLEAHRLIHTTTMDHVCSECGKGFSQESTLKTHMLTHTSVMPHACSDCGRGFIHESSLQIHALTHTGKMDHVCSDCGNAYSKESSLKAHMLTHPAMLEYVCSDCGNAYSKESSLKAHMLTHPPMLDHVCSDCGKAFSQESSLKIHARTHTDTMDYACSKIEYYNCRLCVRGFIHKEDLVDHVDHHTAGK